MNDNLVKILDGNTFVVWDQAGDIEASRDDPTGLFSYDTRFISTWVLTINGERLNALSVDDLQYFETRFFLVPGTGTVYIDAKLSVIRRREVGIGFHEELTILNHSDKPVRLTVRLDAGSDFADLFEVKDDLRKKGKYSTRDQGTGAPAPLSAGGVPTPDDRRLRLAARAHRPEGDDVHVPHRAARRVDDRPRRRSRDRGARGRGPRARYPAHLHAAEPRALASAGSARRVRLGADAEDLPPQPRRPRRAPLLAADRGRAQPPGCRPPLVHDHVRPRQHLHEPAGSPVRPGTRGHDVAHARRLAGEPGRRLPGRGPGPDPPRDAVRGNDRVRGAPALAVLRLRGRDAAVHRPARRVRALDGRPEARPGASRSKRAPRSPGSTSTPTSAATATSGTSAETRRPGSRTSAGRTPGTRSPIGTDAFPGSHERPVSSRGTRTTPRSAVPGSRGWSGRTPTSRIGSRRMPPTSSGASTTTSGSTTTSTSPSRSTPTGSRSTRSARTTGTCCGAESSTSRRPRPSRGT